MFLAAPRPLPQPFICTFLGAWGSGGKIYFLRVVITLMYLTTKKYLVVSKSSKDYVNRVKLYSRVQNQM